MSVYYYLALVHPVIAAIFVARWKQLDAHVRLAASVYIAFMPVSVILFVLFLRWAPNVLFSLPGLGLALGWLIAELRSPRQESG